jgi:hypothetical protein
MRTTKGFAQFSAHFKRNRHFDWFGSLRHMHGTKMHGTPSVTRLTPFRAYAPTWIRNRRISLVLISDSKN